MFEASPSLMGWPRFCWNSILLGNVMNRANNALMFKFLLILLGLVSTSAWAQVQIICAPGQQAVPSEGFVINNGVIEFLDDACGNSGTELPPPLTFTNLVVTPTVVDAGDSVVLTANVGSFITFPTNETYDLCHLSVLQPNGQEASQIALSPLTSALQVTVPFNEQSVAGNWSLKVNCRRFVSQQEVILPGVDAVTVQVDSTATPTGCDNVTAPFQSIAMTDYSATYNGSQSTTGGMGVQFGTNFASWRLYGAYNTYDTNGNLSRIGVRSFRFVAPTEKKGGQKLSSTGGQVLMSISNQCGSFAVTPQCWGTAGTVINWTTLTGDPFAATRCQLVPGQTYYLNFAFFDPGPPVSTLCSCTGSNCQQWCYSEHSHQSIP